MTLSVTIGGIDTTDKVSADSLRIVDRLNSRSRLSLVIHDTQYTLVTEDGDTLTTELGEALATTVQRPQVGSVVTVGQVLELLTEAGDTITTEAGDALVSEAETIFGGFVDSIGERLTISGNQSALDFDLECVSFDAIADRHLVAASYESGSQTLATIVADIVANFLTGENVTTANVQAGGIVVPPVKFNYQTASACFNELATLTGWAWWIDADRDLHFVPRASASAPFGVDSTRAKQVTVTNTPETYRNRQLVRAGLALTASRTENLVGDGTRKAFTLSYPVGDAPTTITVGGVGKTIGVRGKDTGKDWYYQYGDPVISQDDGASAVGSGVAIAVTYQGQYPILIQSQDDAQIASQAELGGGSGVWETIDERPNLNDVTVTQEVAAGLLRRYGAITRRVTIELETPGLRAGQLVTLDFEPHAIAGAYLIDSVSAVERYGRELVYTIECLDGESVGGWVEFFKLMAERGTIQEFRENEVVVLLRANSETVTVSDSLTASAAAPESRVGFALVDYSEVGT